MADQNETHSTHGNKDTTLSQRKTSSPAKLTETGKKGDGELSENELRAVAGGTTVGSATGGAGAGKMGRSVD